MDFSIRLKNLLDEQDLSQKELALELHIANSTISGYLSDYRQPDFEMLIRIAQYFNVTTDYLLGLCTDKNPTLSHLDSDETELVRLYRAVIPKRKKMLIKQARFYYNLSE